MAHSIVAVRTVHDGWLKLIIAQVRTRQGATVRREIVVRGPAVAVLPYDPARRTAMLVRVPRPAVLHGGGPASLLEAPAGIMEDDSAEACARREADEEAGLRLGPLEPVGTAYPTPGAMTETIALFLAPYAAADRIGPGGGLDGEHEDIEPTELPLARLAAMLDAGEVDDLKTLALAWALRARRPELFA